MIFNINLTRGQMRFLTCVARVTCLVHIKQANSPTTGLNHWLPQSTRKTLNRHRQLQTHITLQRYGTLYCKQHNGNIYIDMTLSFISVRIVLRVSTTRDRP